MSQSKMIPGFGDALWNARATASAIEPPADRPLTRREGEAVARTLYDRETEPVVAWKVGATDAAARAWLQTDRPFAAPIRSSTVLAPDAVIQLSELCAPRLEAEIGMVPPRDGGEPLVMPCLEIVDSRIRDWDVAIGELVADFGVHARVQFGAPGPADDVVAVTVEHDGMEVASGSRTIAEATELAAVAAATAAEYGEQPPALVATGTLIPPAPLRTGRWTARFGALGTLSLTVV